MRIERTAGRLIFGFPIGANEAWQLQKRYRRHRDKLFVCLHRDDVEPTKNSSGRDFRNSVVHDKVTGGYRSRRGAEQGAVFATLLPRAASSARTPTSAFAPSPAPRRSTPAGLPCRPGQSRHSKPGRGPRGITRRG